MRPTVLIAALMFISVKQLRSQTTPANALIVERFFNDSGMGFDGHYNRCVLVCCSRRIKSGDTIRIIKLCGGMIGACPESWSLQHWNNNGWYLDRSKNYKLKSARRVEVKLEVDAVLFKYGRKVYLLLPVKEEGMQFGYFVLRESKAQNQRSK